MLARNYKFHIVNNSGVQLDFSTNSAAEKSRISLRRWKFASDSSLSYESAEVTQDASADVANGASFEFAALDNSTDKYLGLHGRFRVETDNVSASGTVDLYVELTTDGGTDYPSDEGGFDPEVDLIQVASVTISGAQAREVNFEL